MRSAPQGNPRAFSKAASATFHSSSPFILLIPPTPTAIKPQSIRGSKADEGRTVPTEARRKPAPRPRRSSCVVIQRRLTALVGHLLADLRNLGTHLEHDRLDAPRVARPPRGAHRAGMLDNAVSVTPAIWSISSSTSVWPHQFVLLLHQPQLQHLGLDRDVISVGLTARRLPPLAPQVSQVGNPALVEGKPSPCPGSHLRLRACRCRSGSIEVLRQCRRADGRGLRWRRTIHHC